MSAIHTNCDTAVAETAPRQVEPRYPKLILTTCILASSMAFIDGSVVNVGLPAISATFGAGAEHLTWIINAYLLPLSALLLLGGGAGDRFGRVRLLVIGTLLFGAGSIVCAIAPNLIILLAARGLQGIGAALLMPNSLAILGSSFIGEARGRAIGIWASMGAMMGAVGPVFGGWLIDTVGWRAIFLLNIPLAAGAIGMALAFVSDAPQDKKPQPLDLRGGALATVALGALTWGLTTGTGRAGWTNPAVVSCCMGLGFAVAFVWVEKIRGERAMMPLALFGSSSFVGLTLLTLLLYGALGALIVLIPYVLIQATGYSGTQAGAALLPFPIVMSVLSPLMGSLAGRIGTRAPLTIGPLIVAVGFLMILRIGADATYWTGMFPAILVIALGMSGAVAPLTTAVLSSVDARHTGSASGLNSAVARTGGLIATALLGGVLGVVGPRLILGFHVAAIVCAIASIGAAASAFFFVRDKTP